MRHGKSPHLFRLALPRYRPAVARPYAEILENAVLFTIGEVERCRKAKLPKLDARRGVHQCDQLSRLRIVERLEQHALDDGEDGRAGSDAQAQGQDADRHEAPIPGQPSGGIAQVAEESIHRVLPSVPAYLFVHRRGAAQLQAGCTERFFPSEPPCGKGSSGFIQEVSNLVGDFLVGRLSVEERGLFYSLRRATTGSTRDARRAGARHARTATPRRISDTTVIVGMKSGRKP